MRIQTKLLLLIVFWTIALAANLSAIGYLAHTIPQVLRDAENVTIRQQRAALNMRAELRDAEAALYRYLMEGEKGFIIQFNHHQQGFENALATYEELSGEEEKEWVQSLQNDYLSASSLGEELIQLSDALQTDAEKMENLGYSTQILLDQIREPSQHQDPDYLKIVNDMQASLQAMQVAVIAYLSSPTDEDRTHFTDAATRFYQALQQFQSLARTPREQEWAQSLGANFSQMQGLGLLLINERDRQMSQFARFAAILFSMGQETLEKKVQPASEQKLILAWKSMLTHVRFIMFSSLVSAILMFVVALAITIPLTRQINGGIHALLAGADRVATGELSEPVIVRGSRELQRLAKTFNIMMADLAARERRLKARISELEGLRQVSLELTGATNSEHIFQTIAESALALATACEVRIFICEADVTDLRFAAIAWRDHRPEHPYRSPRPNGLVMQAARTGEPWVIDHADTHPLFSSEESQQWGVQAAAALPLKVSHKVVGVLNVIVKTRARISKDELRILELLADQAAVSIESARLYAAVADREARLQQLAQKLSHIQEEERRLIGLDLHDGLVQFLLSANMHFNTLESYMAEQPSSARSEFELAHMRLKSAIVEARRVIAELRPAALEALGLIDGLRQYTANLSQSEKWQLAYIVDVPPDLVIPPDVETALFRIAQEALSNARKHAQTDHIRLSLAFQEHQIILEVQDWGRGFRMEQLGDERDRLGLIGMQERTALLNGTFEIESAPNAGVRIRVAIPLDITTRISPTNGDRA